MNFFCAGAADHANNLAAGCAADDGVVDEDDALAFKKVADGVELETNAEVANALLRLNECAAHIVIADETHAEGQARFFGIAHCSGNAGVGDGDDQIRGHTGFAG